VGGHAVAVRHDDLAILDDAADIHDGGAVGWRSGVLHQNGRVRWPLEVAKVPLGRGVVWLHALQSHDEHGLALKVNRPLLGSDGSLGSAPRPEGMAHDAPRVGEVGTEKSLASLAGLETGRQPLDSQVDDCFVIVHRLDGKGCSICGKFDGAVIGIEARLVFAEVVIVELGRAPKVRFGAVEAEDLAVELAGCSDAAEQRRGQHMQAGAKNCSGLLHHVTIDDLGKTEFTSVRHEVEALRLNASRVHGLPFQVIAGELRVGSSLGFDAHRLDGRRTVDGLRRPGDVGQPNDEEANKSDDGIAAMRVGSLDPCDG